jgi:glutaredoxin
VEQSNDTDPTPRLTVYTAHGCCLCDDAREVLDRLGPELGLEVEWAYIDGVPELEAEWREQLPAGVLDGRKVFKYRVDEDLLRRRVAARAAIEAT